MILATICFCKNDFDTNDFDTNDTREKKKKIPRERKRRFPGKEKEDSPGKKKRIPREQSPKESSSFYHNLKQSYVLLPNITI